MRRTTWIKLSALAGLTILVLLPWRVPAAAPVVTIPFDTYQLWSMFDQGWQAFDKNDFVAAHRDFSMVAPLWNALRNNADSPFPPQDYEAFLAAWQYTQNQLRFDLQQYALRQQQLISCDNQLRRCGERGAGLKPSPPGPERPPLRRLPPPPR